MRPCWYSQSNCLHSLYKYRQLIGDTPRPLYPSKAPCCHLKQCYHWYAARMRNFRWDGKGGLTRRHARNILEPAPSDMKFYGGCLRPEYMKGLFTPRLILFFPIVYDSSSAVTMVLSYQTSCLCYKFRESAHLQAVTSLIFVQFVLTENRDCDERISATFLRDIQRRIFTHFVFGNAIWRSADSNRV